MRKLVLLPLIAFFACDKVTEDTLPEVSVQPVLYARPGGSAIVALYGQFERDDIEVVTNSDRAAQIGRIPYVLYDAEGLDADASDYLEFQIKNGEKLLGNASMDVQTVGESGCVNSAFSDNYVVEAGGSLAVNLLENDAFCDFSYTGTGGVRVVDVASAEGVLLSITASSAELTYTAPEGFTGTVEFIYELCFGFGNADPWGPEGNPIDNCRYYYTALATIEVI